MRSETSCAITCSVPFTPPARSDIIYRVSLFIGPSVPGFFGARTVPASLHILRLVLPAPHLLRTCFIPPTSHDCFPDGDD